MITANKHMVTKSRKMRTTFFSMPANNKNPILNKQFTEMDVNSIHYIEKYSIRFFLCQMFGGINLLHYGKGGNH
jgi:hypothetical protein